jgi:methyl-accepting chemotaxis protein
MAHIVLRPALRILDPLPLRLKFGIIASCFLLAAVVPTVLMVRSQNSSIAHAAQERSGVLVLQRLQALARDVILHRLALSDGSGADDPQGTQARRALEAAISGDLEDLSRIPGDFQARLGARQDLDRLQADGSQFLTQPDPARQAPAHDPLLAEISHLDAKVTDTSLLIGDPEVVSSYVVDLSTVQLPHQTDRILRLLLLARQDPAQEAGRKAIAQDQASAIRANLQFIQEDLGPDRAFADPAVARRLGFFLGKNRDAASAFLTLAATRFQEQAPSVPPAALSFAAKDAVQTAFLFQGTALRVLDDLLLQRIHDGRRGQFLALALSVVAALLAFYLLAALHAGLHAGFLAVGSSFAALAGGDLTRRARVGSADELGTMATHLNRALDSVEGLVVQIQVSARTMLASTQGIAHGSQDLASRTESQAANLEQATATVASLSAAVAQTGAQANEARREIGLVDARIKGCQTAVTQAAGAIQEISRSSNQVAGVTRIVEDVAFHANLLAVDAVMAAAAGDRERGFTALASQVHGLGDRSAEASGQIRSLLEAALAAIQRGAASTADAERMVAEIALDLEALAAAIGTITGAALEQSAGLGQISQAMNELDDITQRNAGLAAQTSQGAQALADHAQLLADLTATFKVKSQDPPESA